MVVWDISNAKTGGCVEMIAKAHTDIQVDTIRKVVFVPNDNQK